LSWLWYIPGLVGLAIEVLVIAAMRRSSAYKRYPLVFAYCLFNLCSGVVELAAAMSPNSVALVASRQYRDFYWTNELIGQSLIFLMMITMIYRAMEGVATRRVFCAGLTFVILLAASVSIVASGPVPGSYARWMTVLSRNLSFCSALLNLVLWSALIRRRKRDPQLLIVSAGLGLSTTGKAIGHSLRRISPSTVMVGNLIIVATSLALLLLWWRAFSRKRLSETQRERVSSGSGDETPGASFSRRLTEFQTD
jgi:hypothetical protein